MAIASVILVVIIPISVYSIVLGMFLGRLDMDFMWISGIAIMIISFILYALYVEVWGKF